MTKIIKVSDETHHILKHESVKLKVTIDFYIKLLLDQRKKNDR